jgi:hypothetical protein
MSFSRFVWLLQKKRLWLARADTLGDPWEISLAGDQLAHVISRHPPTTLPLPKVMPEPAMQRSERIIRTWRRRTFISCWSASEHESHALWRIYCPPAEGVAIQTTFAKLKDSVGDVPLLPVVYETPGSRKVTPTLLDLASKKRPMFAYEQEVRVVLAADGEGEADPKREVLGRILEWDPEKIVESVRVHPEANSSFMETVTAVVRHYAPALEDRVAWSRMNERPPF